MPVLLIAEVVAGELALDATARALTAAGAMGEVTALVAGEDVEAAAMKTANLDGVAKVLKADDPAYAHALAEPLTDLVLSLADGFTHIVAPATAAGKNLLPRVAARLDVMVVSDITGVVDAETFERPIYAGSALQTVRSSDKVKVITVRTASLAAAGQGGAAPIESVPAPADKGISAWVADEIATSARPELTSASIVVSGGRGVGSEADFRMITALADRLGAAVGASRAAVDSGFAPNDWQVGQTGKVVAPQLYIAIGISGAIQHLAGMKESRIIVAINKDEEAPIFKLADFGLVGDLYQIVPELIRKLDDISQRSGA